MKRILFTLLVFIPFFANAQYFTLTEQGLVPTNNTGDKFIIIDKEGQTQKELFNQIKSFITSSYVSPKDVMSENGEEMITLNGVSDGAVSCKKGLIMLPFVTNYSIVFMFKDGKIRINNPSINSMMAKSVTLGGQMGSLYQLTLTKDDPISKGRERVIVFKKDGSTTKGAKESIEALFNALIESAVNYTAPNKENW